MVTAHASSRSVRCSSDSSGSSATISLVSTATPRSTSESAIRYSMRTGGCKRARLPGGDLARGHVLHHRGRAGDLGAVELLESAAELRGQELLGARGEVGAVLGALKAVPLVGVEHVRHRAAVLLDGGDDLLRLGLLDARVVRALADQERDLDLVRGEERRRIVDQRGVFRIVDVPDALIEH